MPGEVRRFVAGAWRKRHLRLLRDARWIVFPGDDVGWTEPATIASVDHFFAAYTVCVSCEVLTMIVAFAGRRIDAEGAGEPGKFPLANVDRVRRQIEHFLHERQPDTVVGSAACGADLVVLEAATKLGIRRRVVLPFDRASFRAASVADRPGNWGPRFDEIVASLPAIDVIELAFDVGDETAYERTNLEIFRQCETLASPDEVCVALISWNGETRGKDDVTEMFLNEAKRRSWPTVQIRTNG